MEGSFEITLQIVIAVLAGITAQVIGEYLRVPSIVFLLLFGIILGSDLLNVLHPQELGIGLEVLVALSVAIILFEGGLNLELRELGRVSGSLRNLVTIGTLITLIGGGMAAHWLAEFPWSISFLYASLVVVTGPTVIGPLLKQVRVDRQVATLLEGEGVLIDPVGAILAVVVLNTIVNTNSAPLDVVGGLLFRLGIGSVVGGVGGWLLGLFLKSADRLSEELKNLVVLAAMWGLFVLSQHLYSESGLMATVAAGIVVKASSLPEERLLKRFKGQLTVLCVSVLFILLAADLSIASVIALGWGSLLAVAALMFVVRPVSVFFCTINSDLNWRQKIFLSWIAPKGIVSASVASLFAILLTERGINGGDSIKALVFLTIIMTVFCQGLTAGWVASWLRITSSEAKGAVIVGGKELGRLVAGLFQEAGESVVLIDTDPEACKKAAAENIPVFQSSALDADVLTEAGIESMGTFIALTNNGEVNLVLAQRAKEEFQPPKVLAVFPQNNSASNNNKIKVNQAFIPELSTETWNKYIHDGEFQLEKIVLRKPQISLQQAHLQALIRSGELLPLIVKRDAKLQIVKAAEDWQPEDEIYCILHDPRSKLMKRLSGNNQPSRLALNKFSEVESIPISPKKTIPEGAN
ncbi:Sodium/hydrogen exchanger [Hyella patelloides LEGE 07179]|uniref:Sodium/hydrogen exchanger n=1 Tax=Hyella patelloides LEGE 07179 TaxID=945734 RepID=A0A563VS27_9CYAN|nr:cation:proton antiporter [Hyella patelloides]VEP14192.1 Sodium/hydrogen exchanger [Hyella patelloides LEGE 07179]